VPETDLPSIGSNATSLLALTGQEVDRVQLLDRLLDAVDRRYSALLRGTDPLPVWRATLAWLGSAVEVRSSTESLVGVATGVDDDGALLLRRSDGETLRITAGDVSLRPSPSDSSMDNPSSGSRR
jgi:BirA family biotin operon repressor/biotin-[acetyl-CoA-carboxylase] ligase